MSMRVHISAAEPGNRLSRPVHGVLGQLLLNEGKTLTEKTIMRLQALGVTRVWIEKEDNVNPNPPDALISAETRQRAQQMLQRFAADPRQESTAQEIVGEIVTALDKAQGSLDNMNRLHISDTYTHSVDVCVLAVGLGMELGLSYHQLHELGVGCLLHDVGKIKIPSWVLHKPAKLSAEEYQIVKQHTRLGYDLVCQNQKVSQAAARPVLEHHERYDGSGYPHGKKGSDISFFAAICGLADVYCAMTTDRIYRAAIAPHEIYEMLLATGDMWFDFGVVQAFARCVTPYPPGSLLKLTDGRAAQVKRRGENHPYVPIVRLVNSEIIASIDIDLSRSKVGILGPLRSEEAQALLA